MRSFNYTKQQWSLYEHATEQDVQRLNHAATTAIHQVLALMQIEGISLRTAVNTALTAARDVFFDILPALSLWLSR